MWGRNNNDLMIQLLIPFLYRNLHLTRLKSSKQGAEIGINETNLSPVLVYDLVPFSLMSFRTAWNYLFYHQL